jgi:translation initiation factor 2A
MVIKWVSFNILFRNFVVCAGHSPSKTTLYNNQAKVLKDICLTKVNTIKISPDGKIVLLAGFGNMSGDVEIYRLSDYVCIGKTKFHCGVSLNWSNDCKYLLGAVLSPRLRVDNEYRMLSYNGDLVLQEKFEGEIYECEWVESGKPTEFVIEVSKEYLKKKEEEKKKPQEEKKGGVYMPNSAKSGGGIPGLKKK